VTTVRDYVELTFEKFGILPRCIGCGGVLQCIAVCCSVLQCVAVYCSVLQCIAVCCSVLQCVAVRCNVHCTLAKYQISTWPLGFTNLKNAYGECSAEIFSGRTALKLCHTLQHPATHCNTFEHSAIHCNTLQYTATHCNTLQHTAHH